MILHDVADHADFLVEPAAAFDTKPLGHRDLDSLDVIAVPNRLEKRIRKPEIQQILDRLFAQVVVDAKNSRLRKERVNRLVELERGCQVAPKWLLDNDPRIRGAARRREPFRD